MTALVTVRPEPVAIVRGWRPYISGSLRGAADVDFPRIGHPSYP